MRVTFYGGAQEVGRACMLLKSRTATSCSIAA